MESVKKLFLSQKIVLEDKFLDGGVLVNCCGKIIQILDRESIDYILLATEDEIYIFDYGTKILMPGIIDTHVHVNEPGRTDWEGFETATKAAAAGGITTIVDMPLNSIPPTTSLANLKIKTKAAKNKCFVDVAFWGGVVPGNEHELLAMVEAGVVGFKCFLTPSGVDEFQHVQIENVERSLKILENTNAVLAFHAEIEENLIVDGDPTCYETFLKTRPSSMEEKAIHQIIKLAENYNTKMHIVHLSTAKALRSLRAAKLVNKNLTVETCHHYLTLSSDDIPKKATQFKCCPPIRDRNNRENLWKIGIGNDIIDMVVSDHSPSTPNLKLLDLEGYEEGEEGGNFIKAWGGISSLQFGLSLFWSESSKRGFSVFDVNKYMTRNTAKLVGLHNIKGRIAFGFDADFVIWDPDDTVMITTDMIWHKNKVNPYMGMVFKGKICATVVRGEVVYENGGFSKKPLGKLLIKEEF